MVSKPTYKWLAVWNIWIIFPIMLGIILPTDFHIFHRGRSTTNRLSWWVNDNNNHNVVLIRKKHLNLWCLNFLQSSPKPIRWNMLKKKNWLVVWNIWIIFPFHIWDVILPIDELIFFKMVETTNLSLTIMNYIISIIINHEINSTLTIYKPSSITGKTQPCSIWPFLQASKRSDLARSTSDGAYAVYAPWLVGGFDWQRSPLVVGKNWSWPWVKTIANGHWMG